MKTGVKILVLLLGALLLPGIARPQKTSKPLTNDDVIALVKANLPEQTIITVIGSQATDFDISATGLLKLRKEGVSPEIINAMVAAAGKGHGAPPNAAVPTPAAPPPPAASSGVEIPAGTIIAVRTIDSIDSAKARKDQTFRASLDEPIVVNDQTVAVKGSDVLLKLVWVKQSGKITGAAEITVALESVVINGNRVSVNAEGITSKTEGRGKQSAERIGGGAAVGAIIGAIAGGGRGAAIGAAGGAGVGTAVQMTTKGPQVVIPPETRLSFTVGSGAS